MADEQNQTIQDILETVTFIKDHAVTQDQLRESQNALRGDLVAVMDTRLTSLRTDLVAVMDTKFAVFGDRLTATFEERLSQNSSEVITHVDAFAALHQKLEQELTMLRAKYERLEERMERLEQKFAPA